MLCDKPHHLHFSNLDCVQVLRRFPIAEISILGRFRIWPAVVYFSISDETDAPSLKPELGRPRHNLPSGFRPARWRTPMLMGNKKAHIHAPHLGCHLLVHCKLRRRRRPFCLYVSESQMMRVSAPGCTRVAGHLLATDD